MDNNENQELDLLDVLKSIGNAIVNFFTKTLHIFGWLIRLIYQYKYVCIASIVLFVLLGLYINRTKIYRAETDLKIISYPSYYVKDILDPLHLQSISGNEGVLSKELNMSIEDVKKITDIKCFYYIDLYRNGTPDYIDYEGKYDVNDTTSIILPWRLRIRVEGKDTSLFPRMTEALLHMLTNNEQIKRENELRTIQLDDRIAFVDREIQLLDSLRKKEYFQKKRELSVALDKAILLNERDMKLFHSDMLDLDKAKSDLVWERTFYAQGLLFENEFSYDSRPINGKSKTLPKFVLFGFLFGMLLSCGWKFKERISNYLNRQV